MVDPNGVNMSSHEILDAQAHVWKHIFNFINSMSLKCALELCIPDIIHKHAKPMTLSELIEALHFDKEKSGYVYRLMRILVHSKFFVTIRIFDRAEEEGYWLTSASCLLLRDEPLSMAPFALAMLDPILTDPWHHVSEWLQSDGPDRTAFVTKHGRTIWEYAGIQPVFNQFFNEAMASDARLATKVILEECKQVFEELKSMVDVGGGTGTVAKAISEAIPGLKCTVLDLPHVVAGMGGTEKLAYVGGDMFKSIPHADAVFLKWILCDWSDDECVQILKNCKEAIPGKDEGGKVIIVDMVVGDQKQNYEATETQLLFDMLMMVLPAGKERTEEEWAKLFTAAGFTRYKIQSLLGLRSLIEVFP